MVDCLKSVNATVDALKSQGYNVDGKKYDEFKRLCNKITVLEGFELETLVVDINKANNTISLRLGTYFMEIEDFKNGIFNIFKESKEFSFYVAGRKTPDAMLVIDITFSGFWSKE